MIKLVKDTSHKGYYQDEDGNLYVFRFGGRPIMVDGYRDDLHNEGSNKREVAVEEKEVIDHTKKASTKDKEKYLDNLKEEATKAENDYARAENLRDTGDIEYEEVKEYAKKASQISDELEKKELKNKYGTNNTDIINAGKESENRVSIKNFTDKETYDYLVKKYGEYDDYGNKIDLDNLTEEDIAEVHKEMAKDKTSRISAKDFIKKQTGQKEMYQSVAKFMNDNEAALTTKQWGALNDAREMLKQNPSLIADSSALEDTSKPLSQRLSKFMNDNEDKLNGVYWNALYKADLSLRDDADRTALTERYKKAAGVDDDWFTDEARKMKMSDEDIANAIYDRKGIALNSTDDNIKRIVAGKEKAAWEDKLKKYNDIINDPKTGDWDRNFAKSEIKGIKNEIERYAQYEASFIKRLNRDDEVFNVKYSDNDFVENFKAHGLDEAFALQNEWNKYGDTKIYDIDGNEIKQDKDRKHYTTPTYEDNKKKTMINNYKSSLYGANRASLVSMVHNLGLNWNVENFTDQQLYRMLEKELNRK